MFRKAKLYLFTIASLKREQVFYRIFYSVKKKIFKEKKLNKSKTLEFNPVLVFPGGIESKTSFSYPLEFNFLNLKKEFNNEIDWNAEGATKLWKYNLNYFEFLLQNGLSKDEGLYLIHDYIKNIDSLKCGLDAYPTSLRLINWIKFLAKHKVNDPEITKLAYAQAIHLSKNLEFHVLGNHLLENGFGLLFSSFYLKDIQLFKKAESLIRKELEEEILFDGGHFERSPMYHQLILFRILDSLNLIFYNNWEIVPVSFIIKLKDKAQLMLAWLENITFTDKITLPLFNDSALGVAPSSPELLSYGKKLNLNWKQVPLSNSGYRVFKKEKYEICVDVGEIGPSYVPGHAHSDTFSFVMNIKQFPFIVDTGTSTYEDSPRRLYERSTEAHNTIKVGDFDQSEIWSSFRVARKAHVVELSETENIIKATHDGYKRLGNVLHNREFSFKEDTIIIKDSILNNSREYPNVAYWHFHGEIELDTTKGAVEFIHKRYRGKMEFKGAETLKIFPQKASVEFNTFYPVNRLQVSIKNNELITIIKIF